MTDEQMTELLCKLLEERGIEWKDGDAAYDIKWSTPDGRHCSAMCWESTFTVLISGCTPEQAVDVTLGGGRLTAEQVSKAVYAHSIHADCADADWQAIANELNAELGSGTCKMEIENDIEDMRGEHCVYFIGWKCSECGYQMTSMYESDAPNFCQNCGKKVER